MKKITLILLTLLSFISYDGLAQSYKYHRLDAYLNIQDACVGNTQKAFRVKVNIKINSPLQKNKFYLIDLGDDFNLGMRYCKVLNASNSSGDSDMDLANPNIGAPINVCDFNILRYHRFETFTTLEKAKNNLCGDTTSHDGRYKANIIINRLLSVNKIYQINLGNGLGVRYCKILNRYNGSGDADIEFDGRDIGNSITINCVIDTDNDGIPDSQDNCPNVAGPPSNNGCPIPTGNPDLYIDANNTSISSGCSSCASLLSNIGSNRYLLNPSFGMFIDVSIKNQGTSNSISSNVQYYVSRKFTYDNTAIGLGSISNFNALSPNTNTSVNVNFDYHTIAGILGLSSGSTNANILMVVDKVNINDFNPNESNENNNVTVIPIRISSSNSSSLKASLSSFNIATNKEEKYSIDIFNFTGQKVLSKEVQNTEQENNATLLLPKGLYIIKSEKSDRKIYVN